MSDVNLPRVIEQTTPALTALTKALGIPRELIASDEEIESAWFNLPRVLKKIPFKLRANKSLVRMCIAVSSGLFDSAINYIWNISIVELRSKIKRFGLNVVSQLRGKPFDESILFDLKDAELLNLCLELNLITEEGYFFLDQCRDIRNNFSAAHPTVGDIDDNEFISFVNRCAKYALGDEHNPVGVDIHLFINALKSSKFNNSQKHEWVERVSKTHEAQREMLFGTLHGIYTDPNSSQESRINALHVISEFVSEFSPKTNSDLIDRHSEYIAKGDDKRHKASQLFFEKLGLLELLGDTERHSLISNACKHLMSVHQAYDNFYNEPPFAERLLQITSQGAIPDTAKNEFVSTVVTCAVGNRYGTSHAADSYYKKMISNFFPREVNIMLELPYKSTIVAQRIKSYPRCKTQFRNLLFLIDPTTVEASLKKKYSDWTK